MKVRPLVFILVWLAAFSLTTPVLALDAPVPLSPSNQATTSSSTLNWQSPDYPLYSPKPYEVQVSSSSAFTTLQKDYSTDNTFYTPTLALGEWFWRVKAKDQTGTSSDWSSIESFFLVTPEPTPEATITPEAVFTISQPPPTADATDTLSIATTLSLPDYPNTQFFLKGAFAESGSSNYFGKTYVGDTWIKNSQTFSSQLPITTDAQGSWNGNLSVTADTDDSGFNGEDDYIFKVARYSSAGDLTWSNAYPVHLNFTPPATPQITPTPTPTPKASAHPSPSITASPSASFTSSILGTATRSSTFNLYTPSPLPKTAVKSTSSNSRLIIVGLIFLVCAGVVVWFIKKS